MPWRKKWTYCYGLVKTASSIWTEILKRITKDNDKILYLLTCPNHLVELNKYISTLYTGNKLYNISKQNIYDNKLQEIPGKVTQILLRHFHFIVTNNTKNYETFKHLLNDFQYLKPRYIRVYNIMYIIPYIYTVCKNILCGNLMYTCYYFIFTV